MQAKMSTFSDDNLNVADMFIFDGIETMMGKKEKMVITNIISFSHNVFKKLFSLDRINLSELCDVRLIKEKENHLTLNQNTSRVRLE